MFWPEGLELSDTESPREILDSAREDWESTSGNVMTLLFQEAKAQSGDDMIIVHAKHVPSNRTASLFEVVHRPNAPYPVTIQPKDEKLPKYLKKSYRRESPYSAISASAISAMTQAGQLVENEWVAESPGEFRKRLGKVFNLGVTKAEVLNLVSQNKSEEAPSL
jgi:hypothetical protein